MKQNNKFNQSDFSYSANAEGYMLKYKGQNIGGASILGKFKGRGRSKQISDYAEMARRDIVQIANGHMQPHIREAINSIDQNLINQS